MADEIIHIQLLSCDARELVRGAIAKAQDAISDIAQIERQLWGLLSADRVGSHSIPGMILALSICTSLADSSDARLDKIREYVDLAMNKIENRQ